MPHCWTGTPYDDDDREARRARRRDVDEARADGFCVLPDEDDGLDGLCDDDEEE